MGLWKRHSELQLRKKEGIKEKEGLPASSGGGGRWLREEEDGKLVRRVAGEDPAFPAAVSAQWPHQ